MFLDFKSTCWERISFNNEENFLKVKNYIKNNPKCTYFDIEELIDYDDIEFNLIDNTNDPMTVEENGGQFTLETIEYDDSGKLLVQTSSNAEI